MAVLLARADCLRHQIQPGSRLYTLVMHPKPCCPDVLLCMQGPEDYMAVLLARGDCLRHQIQPGSRPACDVAVSKLRAWFQRGTQIMASTFPDLVDFTLRLPGYWAHVEGVVCQDLDAMRAVWESTTKGALGK